MNLFSAWDIFAYFLNTWTWKPIQLYVPLNENFCCADQTISWFMKWNTSTCTYLQNIFPCKNDWGLELIGMLMTYLCIFSKVL